MKNQSIARSYDKTLSEVIKLLDLARRTSAQAVNAVITSTYWEVGRRIVHLEQKGARRAEYGKKLIVRLAADLTVQFGRGFGERNLEQMRAFYLAFSKGISQSASAKSQRPHFPLPWSHYVKLLSVKNKSARDFYHQEALRGGWSVRQLDRQVSTLFFERTALSRNKLTMLTKGTKPRPSDKTLPTDEIRDPYVLEFLGLKDEYSETELENAMIQHMETFLLELGSDFAFIGRQRRLRIGNTWYRVDLVFFHRTLRCLVVIDLKIGEFTHSDAGQMHLYLNYAKEHWTRKGENPPVGLILCAEKDDAVVKYALDGLPNKVVATKYMTALPEAKKIAIEVKKTRLLLEKKHKRV